MNSSPRNNGLFALERSLLQHKPPEESNQPTDKPTDKTTALSVQAMAFDFDEAIELHYDGNTYGYRVESQPLASESFAAEEEEPIAFEVESFAAEPEVPYPTVPSILRSADPPLRPTVVTDRTLPVKSAQPIDAAQSFPLSVAASEDEVAAFAADLKSILSGEKYQDPTPDSQMPTKAEEPAYPPSTAQSQTPAEPNLSQSHAIFDQIAQNMSYANAFDLGTLAMEQRFDAFDRALDGEGASAMAAPVPEAPAPILSRWVAPFSMSEAIVDAQSYDDAWSLPFDLDTAGLVENFGITSGASGESFDMRYEVPLIPQQTGFSAWAASAAMLVAWRDEMPLNLTELAQGTGAWTRYKSALQTEDTSFFKAWGLATKPAQVYTVDSFIQLIMDTFGPIWVAADPPGSHVRVITGVYGDGTADGTFVLINDPWKADMTTFQEPNPGAIYKETYQQFMKKQLAMTRQGNPVSALYVGYLQEPVGKALLTQVAADED
jgi:Papain-like cysteine protease AvrRpt2